MNLMNRSTFSKWAFAILSTSTSAALVFGGTSSFAAEALLINGAGATFPAPIYTKWFKDYNQLNPNVEINYQGIGSGGGIKQFTAKTVDFGASDAPMSDEEIKAAGGAVLHIPTVLGAVVMTYNITGVKKAIRLDGAAIADIFMGKITKWNDARIKALNPSVAFPDLAIVPVYRSDSSGTTAVFTEYLTKASPAWKTAVGAGKAVKWPSGLGGKGNEGVTGQIENTPGAIGYVELSYAMSQKMPFADVKNRAGQFVTPSIASVTEAAAAAVKSMPADFRVSITDGEGKAVYPIASFTYLLIYPKMPGAKGAEFVKFLSWAMDKGQKSAPELSYAPLPGKVVALVKQQLKKVTTN